MELNDKKFAVLVDADNISHRKIKDILDEIANYGTPTIKRIYGDFTNPKSAAWKEVLLENSITPIQQYAYTTGKNATDSALIIDAMDILHKEGVDGFCIVSSDSDYTRLASRIRESGREVLGFLQKLNQEGDTVVLITHDNSIAVKAKRIVRLQDGRIIYDGDASDPAAVVQPEETGADGEVGV